jgi:hypothetical protein
MLVTFRHIKNYIYLILACCSVMYATKAMEQQTSFATLPTEAKVHIISFLVSAKNVQEAIKNIKALAITSKYFSNFINDPRVLDSLIKGISKHFDKPLVEAAIAFSTPSALKWLKDHLQQHPQEKEPLTKHLLEAIEKGNKNLIEFALHAGADINAQDKDGYTRLHWATFIGNKDIVELLLKAGADVNKADNYGKTSLHKAARKGYKDIVELLLQHGADINAQDMFGRTPLHWAAYDGNKLIVELLLEKDANARIKSNNNQTAAQLAVDKGYYDIAALLAKASQEQYSKEHRDIPRLRGLLKGYH